MPLRISLKHEHTADATLEIHIDGLDSVMALKRHITVLLSDITSMECSPPEVHEAFRLTPRLGVHVPGVMSKGRVFGAEGNSFYYFVKPTSEHEGGGATGTPESRVLGISLDKDSADAQFVRLVIEVPEGTNWLR
ncbi:hypothetical protein BCR44DRAFT_1174582 [Catenaria anguillulae PL171]|uniref:Uncharacterized protein n=1 Tax=Catenaria anguillulae PL171 TaxID=765915 RepID=A0A1Y2I122_9FUNG|nr:hypothetical protein BCR44DRAFT_1174582 [Catenaria anguillulae PL171]